MSENTPTFSQQVRDSLCEGGLALKKRCCRRALYHGSLTYRRMAKQSAPFIKLFEKLSGEGHGLPGDLPLDVIIGGCDSCAKNYLRGVFIACGTMTDPDSSTYQLEMRVSDAKEAAQLSELITECGFFPKTAERSGSTVLYFKDSESIEDFLNYIGATKAAFSVMNAKILRELRNNANRLTNCETANIDKTVNAAMLQIEAFEKLTASGAAKTLSDELRATMELRMDNPDATLPELARLHNPPISKSGVNHRLKKLMEIAENI